MGLPFLICLLELVGPFLQPDKIRAKAKTNKSVYLLIEAIIQI